ncbi:MAG: pyruvate kinase, partial [Thermoanaerobaculia bacterium]
MSERRTKIIATLGPASHDPQVIRELVAAGMDAARLNFSHGDHETHRRACAEVRAAGEAAGRAVAVIQDIQGPKIRMGRFAGGSLALERDQTVRLAPGAAEAAAGTILIDYPELTEDIAAGETVYLADGQVRLEVTGREAGGLSARVVSGGTVRDRQGAAFPDSALALSPLTEKDRTDLAFGRTLEVDYVAASFVSCRRDVEEVAALSGVPVIAKIERAAAVRNLPEILAACHAAMVARGDLGV